MFARVRGVTVIVVAALAAVMLVATACDEYSIEYVSQGTEYALAKVDAVHDAVAVPDYGDGAADRAADLRHKRLSELRATSDEAALAADLLTTQFPNEERAVPYYVEFASVNGAPAWIVLEVVASDSGALDRERLWVFDRETGDVLKALSFN